MPTEAQLHAIRRGVAWSRQDHVAVLRVSGEEAFELLDAVSPRPLFVRDGQMLHTVFLDDRARPIADVYICLDDLDYLVLAEGIGADALTSWLLHHAPPGLDAEVTPLAEHALIGLDGPYSWELMSDLVGPEVVGVPYLTLFTLEPWPGLGFRAGKTGEYGYQLLIPEDQLPRLLERLHELGPRYDLTEVGVDTLDLCALENGFFSIRTPGITEHTVAELQLLWRVSLDRSHPGSTALSPRSDRRITWFRGPEGQHQPCAGEVRLEGRLVGEVLYSVMSPVLDRVIGLVMLDTEVAVPGLSLEAGIGLQTVSTPLLWNRSLALDLQRHCFAGRDIDEFPPIVPP